MTGTTGTPTNAATSTGGPGATVRGTAASQGSAAGFDLLRVPGLRAIVRSGAFPYVFQVVLLVGLIALIVGSWRVHAAPELNGKLFAKTNLATLLVWGIWWPLMIWVAVLLGRAWCMVCPLELVSNLGERLGRVLRLPQRPLRGWLAAGALIVACYAFTQVLVIALHMHRVPAYTAMLLTGLAATAAVTGLLFRDRAFCRGFCPVGLLLGTYGRGGMLAVRPGDAAGCRECDDRSCVSAARRHRLDARSCPSLLNPARLDSNRDCLLCTQCVKTCSHQHMSLRLRTPFHRADRREPLASLPVLGFVMLASGFVTWELFTEWSAAEAVFLQPPNVLAGAVGLASLATWLEAAWILLVVPAALWGLFAGVAWLLGARDGILTTWRRLALPIVVIIAAGHMAKGLAKLVSWAQFLPGALADPAGASTAAGIAAKELATPAPLMSISFVSTISLVLLAVAFLLGAREAHLANGPAGIRPATLVPMAVLAGGFLLIVAGW
jgi:polyferredoxin